MRYTTSIPLALAVGAANAMNTKVPTGAHSSGFLTVTTATLATTTSTAVLNTTGWRQVQTTPYQMPTIIPFPDEEQPYPDDQWGTTWTWIATAKVPTPAVELTKTSGGVLEVPQPTAVTPVPLSNENGPIIGPWKIPAGGPAIKLDGLQNDTDVRTPFSDAPGPVIPDEDDFEMPEVPDADDIVEDLIREGMSRQEAEAIRALMGEGSKESKAVEEDTRKVGDAMKALARDFRRLRHMAKAH
ncbi:hypothetical protein MCOR29_003346 [Pyricularia oryzae]|nr:hypothetical protein MCOR29_003346 [Pyricularia oryzae]KAI6594617.1 hypothetical protein MCOR06_003257 [Pyricularia oryzae]